MPRLLRSLRRGQTGCLFPGRYSHRGPARLGQADSELRGLGGGRARVDGPIWVTAGATGARVTGLSLTSTDRTYFIPLKVQADGVRIARNRIFGSRSTTCVLVGSVRRAHGVRIERNHIRHCGRRGKFDHLIYVADASGTVIRRNLLDGNPGGWGVHLYPNADRTVVEHNVIDGNHGGVIFAGDDRTASDENVVRYNAITFSRPRRNIESSWDGPVGHANYAYGNCLYTAGASRPAGIGQALGFGASMNMTLGGSPYSSRRRGDYRFRPGDRCAQLVAQPLDLLRR